MFNRGWSNAYENQQYNNQNNRQQNSLSFGEKIKLFLFATYLGIKAYKAIKQVSQQPEIEDEKEQDIQNDYVPGDLEITSAQEQRLIQHEEFVCPISMSVMRNPVSIGCGHTFDNEDIKKWLQTNDKCPLCNKPVRYEDARPNYSIRSLIEKQLNNQYILLKLYQFY